MKTAIAITLIIIFIAIQAHDSHKEYQRLCKGRFTREALSSLLWDACVISFLGGIVVTLCFQMLSKVVPDPLTFILKVLKV